MCWNQIIIYVEFGSRFTIQWHVLNDFHWNLGESELNFHCRIHVRKDLCLCNIFLYTSSKVCYEKKSQLNYGKHLKSVNKIQYMIQYFNLNSYNMSYTYFIKLNKKENVNIRSEICRKIKKFTKWVIIEISKCYKVTFIWMNLGNI